MEPVALSEYPNPGMEGARAPSLRLDGKGGIYVLWEHLPDVNLRARGLGFAHAPDGGRNFSDPIIIPGSDDPRGAINGSLQGQLARKLSVNQTDAVAVTNSHFFPQEDSRILLIRAP